MKLDEALRKRLRELLNQSNITIYQLYCASGLPKTTVYDTFSGAKKRVSVETICELCSTLNISLKDFFDSPLFDELD